MSFDLTGFGSIADLLNGVVSRIWPDKTKQDELKADIQKAQLAGALQEMDEAWKNAAQQLEVNKVEAASTNLFVSGWRPFCGWCCGSAFAYTFILQPFLVFLMVAFHSSVDPKTLPVLDVSQLMPVLLGMLGLGGMRTFEKAKGIVSGH